MKVVLMMIQVLIGTDFGDGKSFTDSGYPRVIKSWMRGTPLSEAKTVFEVRRLLMSHLTDDSMPMNEVMGSVGRSTRVQVENEDIGAHQYAYHDRGHVHEFQLRQKTFYASEQWCRRDASRTRGAASAGPPRLSHARSSLAAGTARPTSRSPPPTTRRRS